MTLKRGQTTPPSEAGFALIEVLISALIAVTMTGAVVGLLNATGRAGAEQRNRTQAYAIAQEDQARLRAMRITELDQPSKPREVTLNGTKYEVASTASFINSQTNTASCESGSNSADYVKVSSTVSWKTLGSRNPVVIESIVSPPTGSLDPTHGTLEITAVNAQNQAISGVGLSATTPATISGSTDSKGCAVFADLPEGNYLVTPSLGSEYIDENGDPPATETIGVVAGSIRSFIFQYDKEGSIPVTFKYREGSSSNFKASTADAIVATNSGMSAPATFGTPGGTRVSSIVAEPIYPFKSTVSVYAGCTGNNPGVTNEAVPSVTVPPGGSAPVTIQLPALNLKVWTGKSSSSKGVEFNNADVWIRDENCSSGGKPVLRRYATNSSGSLPDPGLPWSRYDVCADTLTGSATTGGRRQKIENVDVKNLTTGTTTINFYLGEGTNSSSEGGQCS